MFYEKVSRLASILVNYSLSIKKGEKVLIDIVGNSTDLILKELVIEILKAGAIPLYARDDSASKVALMTYASEEQMKIWGGLQKLIMENVDAYIRIAGANNAYSSSSVPQDKMKNYMKYYQEVVHTKLRVPRGRWVVLRWPNDAMAQLAQMNTDEFAKFYFDTCTLDYEKMGKNMQALVDLMKKTDKVRLVGPKTDISFSIKGLPPQSCDGKMNIPDGEVYTAPIKDSMNGYITYNAPSLMQGKLFTNVRLEVKNGRIEKAFHDGDQADIDAIFNTDEGARYFGEFAIGVNPFITKAIKDTLFDEKIYGSFHLTPGASYDECFNGNKSAVHWDLVQIQTKEWGGGEIYFDDRLIRKDGEFLVPELRGLNK